MQGSGENAKSKPKKRPVRFIHQKEEINMKIIVKGRKEWKKDEWTAYRKECEDYNRFLCDAAKWDRPISEMNERED